MNYWLIRDDGPPMAAAFDDDSLEKLLVSRLPNDAALIKGVGSGPILKWSGTTPLHLQKKTPILDIVWSVSPRRMISDRVKRLLEELVPGEAQFLPLQPTFKGRVLDLPPYWVVNPRWCIDALYLEPGKVIEYTRGSGQFGIMYESTLNPRLVPAGLNLFNVRYCSGQRLYVSERVCKAIRRAKLDGVALEKQKMSGQSIKSRAKFRKFVKPKSWSSAPTFLPGTPMLKKLRADEERASDVAAEDASRENYVLRVLGKNADDDVELGQGCGASAVEAAEDALGVKLPASYRSFLRTCGSAIIQGEEIYGIPAEKGQFGFVKATLALRKWMKTAWPKHMIVVAADGRGGDYCLDLSKMKGDDCPVVYHDHELDEIDEKTEAVTPSFEKVKPTFKAWVKQIGRTGSMLPE